MFGNCSKLTALDVSGFNTEKVVDMYRMFENCSSLTSLDVSNFNTSNVTSMFMLFSGCSGLTSLDVTNFNLEKVSVVAEMFEDCTGLTTLDISNFNTGNAFQMESMFIGCSNLKTIYVDSNWSLNPNTEGHYMFEGCTSLVGGKGTAYNSTHRDQDYARIDGGPNSETPGYFTDKNAPVINPEPYAVLSNNNTVLTFYYDEEKEARGGISLDKLNFDSWTSLAAIVAGSVSIPAEEYAKIGNPNLLVYVEADSLAPQGVKNVVVNGVAKEIVLTDATSGNNNWYCPQAFRAERISYTRNFRQQTVVGISRGWESIALPFTVQTITHATQGQITPFGANGTKHFWLRGYSPNGLQRATVLEANTPYLISMPNNPEVYPSEYNLNGQVTFSAENITVPATPSVANRTITRGDISMTANFLLTAQSDSVYAVNVGLARDGYPEGSVFAQGLRDVRPFEAYTTHGSNNGARPRNIRIAVQPNEDITGIKNIENDESEGDWYTIEGYKMQNEPKRKGVYIHNGKKVTVK
jgi:surface protein